MKRKIKLFVLAILIALNTNLFAQTLEIDFRFNTQKSDKKNHLIWIVDGKKTSDTFDAITSASKKYSTGELRKVLFDKNSNLAPKGLYSLLLFAISPLQSAQKDELEVQQTGKKITLSFTHRGNAYKIQSDNEGFLSLEESFLIFKSFAQNNKGVFTVKSEYADSKNSERLDWEKLTLENDTPDPKSNKKYTGKLKVSLKNEILRIKGKLKLEEIKEEAKTEAEAVTNNQNQNSEENEEDKKKTLPSIQEEKSQDINPSKKESESKA
ncbi:hypothetical protein [Treponema pectinovorum]|uniref:hypothetical protein n=1 Tax=Treponema pectinovorum TaxID=164 RepID=UPI0011CA4270|nr:hypothetical protein [Treponema pectinovorum]